MHITHPELVDLYRRMRTIRAFELKLEELVTGGRMGGFLHLYVGQEAVAVGVCRELRGADLVASTHRPHGHLIAKGLDLTRLLAELFGRATGYCKGKGGSMHIADLDKGMLGANGVVGAGIPLATGAALSAKLRRTGVVVVAFLGEGASNQGMFHESLNMAANWKLPVVYVVEHNGWGEFTPAEHVLPVKDVATRAASYAMPSAIADGMDVLDVAQKAREAIARAREGLGPTLLECKTYRFHGHFIGDPMKYRSKAETERWVQTRDPLALLERRALEAGVAAAELRAVDAAIERELLAAVAAAEAAPPPALAEITADVYAGGAS
jgi:acetoin:2,6-dichlorophenolindophenol oxidoreductase subunit alpha